MAVSGQNYDLAPSKFDQTPSIFTLKLSSELLEKLENGEVANMSICLGDASNTLMVDGTKYDLAKTGESTNLFCVEEIDGAMRELGLVKQRFMLRRDLDQVREETRQRTLQEEMKKKDNRIQSYDAPASSKKVVARNVKKRQSTTPLEPSPDKKPKGIISPAGPQPARGAKPDGSFALPGPARKGAAVRPTKDTKSPFALRTRLVHLLAVQPLSMKLLEERLGESKEVINRALKPISLFRAPGRYLLLPEFLKEVDVENWPEYSPDERNRVREKIKSQAAGASADELNSSQDLSSQLSSQADSQTSNEDSQTVESMAVEGTKIDGLDKGSDMQIDSISESQSLSENVDQSIIDDLGFNPLNEKSIPPLIDTDLKKALRNLKSSYGDVKPIEGQAMYQEYTMEFKEKHVVYQNILKKLELNSKLFECLGTLYTQCPEESKDRKQLIHQRIEKLYHRRKVEVDMLKGLVETLHVRLQDLKQKVHEFVQQHEGDGQAVQAQPVSAHT
eukprot:GILK01004985.1.p1 GENE.GILK01004985.1~~GILK01004985.1.p1  ORF type:complete len:504 (+),score=92.33 GILK01004985.1:89-1600(+)